MLVNFNDKFFTDVAEELLARGLDIKFSAYWCQPDFEHKLLHESHDQITGLDIQQFVFSHLIHQLNRNNVNSLCAGVLKDLAYCENLFLSISDRFCYFPLSMQARKSLYLELLLYWHTFLTIHPVEIIIFQAMPHMGWDNIVYELARRLDIMTLHIERTFKDRVLVVEDYQKVEKVPTTFLEHSEKNQILDALGKTLFDDAFKPSSWLKISQQRNRKAIIARDESLLAFKALILQGYEKIKAYGFQVFRNLFSPWLLSSAVFFNRRYRTITIRFLRFFFSFYKQRLYRFYTTNTSPVDYESPYVFFALHFQPEKNTTPQGGAFETQLLAIKMLANSLPEGWTLYVKEHPKQFATQLNTRHARSIRYYQKLLDIDKVRLVKIQEDAEKLVKNARFNATLRGTVGWQGLLHKKACIAFGYAWYAGCNSCYFVQSVEECRRAIKSILEKQQHDIELDVLKFLAYYKDSFILSANSNQSAHMSEVPYETLVENLAIGILQHAKSSSEVKSR